MHRCMPVYEYMHISVGAHWEDFRFQIPSTWVIVSNCMWVLWITSCSLSGQYVSLAKQTFFQSLFSSLIMLKFFWNWTCHRHVFWTNKHVFWTNETKLLLITKSIYFIISFCDFFHQLLFYIISLLFICL